MSGGAAEEGGAPLPGHATPGTAVPGTSTPGRSLGGRFSEATDALLERLNRSTAIDWRLWSHDIDGSRAHVRMLAAVGLVTDADRDAVLDGLDKVATELADGAFVFAPTDEDIHMAVERRLTELVGEPARRLHTGRSRNDQVMTDTLLWLRRHLDELEGALVGWVEALLARAADGLRTPMPAMTHYQPAQVGSVASWLLSHAAAAERNLRRLRDLRGRLDECPLGSGACAGGYLPLDREQTARELGFARPTLNATQATSSRGDLQDALGVHALIGVDLSRLGEELVLFTSPVYGWLRLPDRLTTGSSLLPHKRNPDGAELLRGGGKLAAGELAQLASLQGGLASGYSKDLQHDKALLFAAADRTLDLLALARLHVEGMVVRADRMRAACAPPLAALYLADRLVRAGVPFRRAHHLVGEAASAAERDGVSTARALIGVLETLPEALPADDAGASLRVELERLEGDGLPDALLEQLVTQGSAGPASCEAQIGVLRQRLQG